MEIQALSFTYLIYCIFRKARYRSKSSVFMLPKYMYWLTKNSSDLSNCRFSNSCAFLGNGKLTRLFENKMRVVFSVVVTEFSITHFCNDLSGLERAWTSRWQHSLWKAATWWPVLEAVPNTCTETSLFSVLTIILVVVRGRLLYTM